jgi:hypothetical protein
MGFCCSSDWQVYVHSSDISRYCLQWSFSHTQGIFSGIFFSALGPVLSEVVPLSDFSDALSIIWLVCAPITLVCTPIAFALNEYSKSTLGMTGSDMFRITIGTAGGANIAAAIALFAVKKFQRKEQDV